MVMRRTLGTLILLLGLAGCGQQHDETDQQPRTDQPYPDPVFVTGTAAGGTVSAEATVLGGPDDVEAYADQFDSESMQADVAQAADDIVVADGQELVAATVSIGCDVPTDVEVTSSKGGLQVVAEPVPSPKPECFAPMTTVALVVVPAGSAG